LLPAEFFEENLQMKSLAAAIVCRGLAAAPALGADYEATEKSPLYALHLRAPETAMTIPALKDKILALYKADADQAKSDAKDDKESNPSFSLGRACSPRADRITTVTNHNGWDITS
jgi:hypothetical protein